MIPAEIPRAPLRTFLRMARQNGPIPPRRWPRLALYVLRHLGFAPLRAFETRRHAARIAGHRFPAPPIFVVGHWRSGTTLLQTLLAVDPRHTTNTVYRAVFPGTCIATEGWLKPVLGALARALRLDYEIQRAKLDFDLVAEADVALCLLGSPGAYSWGHLYPEHFERWLERCVLDPTDAERDRWRAHHDFLLRKLSYIDGGKRVVSKTPGDMGRLPALLRQYPDARFVYIRRDPIAVFHSNRYLWDVIHRRIALQTLPPERLDAVIIRTRQRLFEAYARDRTTIPPGQLVEVDCADLRADPLATLDRIYSALDLGDLPRGALQRHLDAQPPYVGGTYDTPPALAERLKAAWGLD